MKNNEVKMSDIKKWTNDYLKWYREKYNIENPSFPGSPYDIQNKYTMQVLADIFEHMVDDLENNRPFSKKSKEHYDKLVTPED